MWFQLSKHFDLTKIWVESKHFHLPCVVWSTYSLSACQYQPPTLVYLFWLHKSYSFIFVSLHIFPLVIHAPPAVALCSHRGATPQVESHCSRGLPHYVTLCTCFSDQLQQTSLKSFPPELYYKLSSLMDKYNACVHLTMLHM